MKPTPTPLTLGDIARYCHVDRVTVQRWVKNNFIPAYRTPGGHYRVPKDVFRKFLQKNNMPIFQEFFDDLSIRVLIADTPLDEAETLANFLRHAQMGYEIRTCSTGRETLLLWGIYQPDIVVLNVDLDGLGGPGVCGDAKKMFGDGLVHIVAISSDVHQSEPIILAAGADRFIKKPINADQVMESIQTILPPGLRGSYSRTKTQN